jgi:ankyrin repeat protein
MSALSLRRDRRLGIARFAIVPIVLLAMVVVCPMVPAHETDQYTAPAGREFADLGPYFNNFFYACIERGVNKTNARIRAAIESGKSQQEIAALQDPELVTHAVNEEFPYAIMYIQQMDDLTTSPEFGRRYPGYVTGYKPLPSFKKIAMFPLNPFRAWGCADMKVYGVYCGADKIGHFTDMGMHYYQTYRGYLKKGLSEEQAVRKAIQVGIDDPLKGESKLLGYWTAGDYSNADLVSNYMGMVFYRNLTEPQMLKGQLRSPMLERDGPYWRAAAHVRKDSDFLAWFIPEHFDEALNPGHFVPGMRSGMRDEAVKSAEAILDYRADRHGNRHSQAWFAKKTDELKTYWGFDYGHRGSDDELVRIDRACFPTPSDPNGRDIRGRMPLHRAIDAGDARAVASLLDAGANVNEPIRSNEQHSSEWGNTPLHLAARDGRDDIVRLLLSRGANFNAQNDRGITPLHLAAAARESTAQLLLDAGARVDLADERGQTALHWAATDAQPTMIALLVARGAKVNARDRDGRTPLYLAAAEEGHSSAIVELLRRGADANASDMMHVTPLHVASALHDHTNAQTLLTYGASAAVADDFGRTPLHDAVRIRSLELARLLIQRGAPVNVVDAFGRTPIQIATRASGGASGGASGAGDLVALLNDAMPQPTLATHRQTQSPPQPIRASGAGYGNGAPKR